MHIWINLQQAKHPRIYRHDTNYRSTHLCDEAEHKNINRRIEWIHLFIFLPPPALDNFATQVYYMPGDHFMLQSIIGIERTISRKQHSLRL